MMRKKSTPRSLFLSGLLPVIVFVSCGTALGNDEEVGATSDAVSNRDISIGKGQKLATLYKHYGQTNTSQSGQVRIYLRSDKSCKDGGGRNVSRLDKYGANDIISSIHVFDPDCKVTLYRGTGYKDSFKTCTGQKGGNSCDVRGGKNDVASSVKVTEK